MTETTQPPGLRDRLYAVMTEFEAKEPVQAVEAVCDQLVVWLRQQAEASSLETGETMLYGRATGAILDGLAQGILQARSVAPSGTEPQ